MAVLPIILLNGTTADANQVMDDFYEIYDNISEVNVPAGNKTGSGKFVLQTSPTITGATISGSTTLTGFTAGSILFAGPSSVVSQDNANFFWNDSTNALSLGGALGVVGNATFDTNTLFVDSVNHRVGIGTITPDNRLTIEQTNIGGNTSLFMRNKDTTNPASGSAFVASVGGASAGDPYIVFDIFGISDWTVGVDNSDSDQLKIDLGGTVGGNTFLSIDTFGNVGINTTTHVHRLDVNGSIGLTSQLTSTLATGFAPLVVASTTKVTNLNADLLDGFTSDDFLQVADVGGAKRFTGTFEVNGNLSVFGNISLPLAGTSTLTDDGTYLLLNGHGTSVQAGLGYLGPSSDNTIASGIVAGPLSRRWTAVYAVNGTIQTSDARDKKQILDSDLGLDFINKLRPVSYHWKEHDNGRHYGLIAQELQSALDGQDFAGIQGEEKLGLNYSELIAPMVKAIQELNKKVERLTCS